MTTARLMTLNQITISLTAWQRSTQCQIRSPIILRSRTMRLGPQIITTLLRTNPSLLKVVPAASITHRPGAKMTAMSSRRVSLHRWSWFCALTAVGSLTRTPQQGISRSARRSSRDRSRHPPRLRSKSRGNCAKTAWLRRRSSVHRSFLD